ncbi:MULTISPECIES: hypothetical protein [Chryseobacterium]|uniref:hypothetical protein n=1 Tax=Chryseobacterium TaxID=59732 RepID=UPI001294F8B3|nr:MULTISPECIES: hypothetical protein [Chryseobacterium]MDR6923712.1 hypothetical protein [Chryseobacterium sp. 2987]
MASEKYDIALIILLLVISVSKLRIVMAMFLLRLSVFLFSDAEKYFLSVGNSGDPTDDFYLKKYTRPPPFLAIHDHKDMNWFISPKTQIP